MNTLWLYHLKIAESLEEHGEKIAVLLISVAELSTPLRSFWISRSRNLAIVVLGTKPYLIYITFAEGLAPNAFRRASGSMLRYN
jgi:hypothetical protein